MNWWLEYGLDGIVGGVVGGAATGAAVAATLWNERRRSASDLVDRETQRLASVTRRLRRDMSFRPAEFMLEVWDWGLDVDLLTASTRTSEACFSALLFEARSQVSDHGSGSYGPGQGLVVANQQRLVAALSCAERLLQRRMYTPEYFKMTKETCEQVRKAIEMGAFI